jgi:hypothetical protein
MPKSSGPPKGNGFEIEIGRLLSRWITCKERDDLFARCWGSGGVYTQYLKKGKSKKAQPGDLVAVRPEGFEMTSRFMIECKFWKNLGFTDFLLGLGKCHDELTKAMRLAGSAGKFWMYIIKQNNCPIVLLMPTNAFRVVLPDTIRHTKILDGTVYLMRFKEFMDSMTVKEFFSITHIQPTVTQRVPLVIQIKERGIQDEQRH